MQLKKLCSYLMPNIFMFGIFIGATNIAATNVAWGVDMECYIEETLCIPIPEKRTDYNKDELLLLLKKEYPASSYESLLRKYGLDELSTFAIDSMDMNLVVTDTNGKDSLVLEKKINRMYEDLEASTNNIYKLEGITKESFKDDLYPKSLTGAQEALKISRGKGVLIGMIDGPVDIKHQSLAGRVEQQSLVGSYPRSFANLLHGTTVAGILVSSHEAIGIAPEARVFSIPVFSALTVEGGASYTSNSTHIARAIDIAIHKKVDILNLSFAGGSDRLVKKAINMAISKGIIVVASCGNDASSKPRYPAAIEDVIAVTAVDSLKRPYIKANKGRYIDVAAPGVSILSTAPGDRYDLSTGTSFAAANVSGSLALLLAKKRNISRDLLSSTATDLGEVGHDESFGDGLINVLEAMKSIQ